MNDCICPGSNLKPCLNALQCIGVVIVLSFRTFTHSRQYKHDYFSLFCFHCPYMLLTYCKKNCRALLSHVLTMQQKFVSCFTKLKKCLHLGGTLQLQWHWTSNYCPQIYIANTRFETMEGNIQEGRALCTWNGFGRTNLDLHLKPSNIFVPWCVMGIPVIKHRAKEQAVGGNPCSKSRF